jgi:hypothetical protein
MKDVRFDFTGRSVVVTGAGNGIGAACARLFAASGARVALWDIDAAAAQALPPSWRPGAAKAACNVARSAEVRRRSPHRSRVRPRRHPRQQRRNLSRRRVHSTSPRPTGTPSSTSTKGAFLVGRRRARSPRAAAARSSA